VAIGRNGAVVRQLRTFFSVGTIRELTDGQLLERFATSGGEAAELAFAALVERHGPMVLRVCRSVLTDPHDTQDVFQATFLVLVKKARGLWVRDSLGPWLHQVAYRSASCARSAAARRHRHEKGAAALRKECRVEVRDEDLGRVLHEEIERLPDRFRVPLILCELEGRSHEQAARHLGWPVGTVKSRQARGRERLRDRLRVRGVAPHASVPTDALRPDEGLGLVSVALVDSTIKAASQFVTRRAILPGSTASLAQGVLRSMSITQWLKVAAIVAVLGVTASGAGLLAFSAVSDEQSPPKATVNVARAGEIPVHVAKPGKLRVTTVERGLLESSENKDTYCLVEGQTTIIMILPEGTVVKKGQIACILDSASLKDQLVNQKIAENAAQTAYENAKLAREVAEFAVREYEEGTLNQERSALSGTITLAQSAIQEAEARRDRARSARKRVNEILAAKAGATSPTDIVAALDVDDRIATAEQTVRKERMVVEMAKAKQDLLEKYTSGRTTKALVVDIQTKRAEELAKNASLELQHAKARKIERQIANCDIKAPADGMIVYANDPNRLRGRLPQIEQGATVRERQKIFSVPDISRIQVNISVSESQIAKVARNMKATVRVDAFADQVLNGRVMDVAPLPASTSGFDEKKVYTTKVWVDNRLPGLRPGMTAQVEILNSELDNVLSVPVEAVVRYDDKDHVAVKKPDGQIEWREVTLGLSNGELVEVKQGIKTGDQVVVKPLALLSEQQKAEMRGSPTPPAARPKGSR
jgi:HlyD family secretion protein